MLSLFSNKETSLPNHHTIALNLLSARHVLLISDVILCLRRLLFSPSFRVIIIFLSLISEGNKIGEMWFLSVSFVYHSHVVEINICL